MKRVKRCDVCLVILAVILIAWGIFGLVWLPDIYDTIVHKVKLLLLFSISLLYEMAAIPDNSSEGKGG